MYNANHGNTEREARFNSQPPEGGWISIYFMLHLNLPSFNSQPPEGGWWLIVIDRDLPKLSQLTAARRRLEKVSTVYNANHGFQLTAARRRLVGNSARIGDSASFNSQPPEGGWLELGSDFDHKAVSTQRRPKAAGNIRPGLPRLRTVSTPSRPKAAGGYQVGRICYATVSTHSRPKAAGKRLAGTRL